MAKTRHVAVMVDLDWPYKHHHEVFVGTQHYAREHAWNCIVDPHADQVLRSRRSRSPYDGIIARATKSLAERARRARVPVVNVWLNSPAGDLPSVFPDSHAAGRMAAEHLLARGFRHFGFLGFRRDRDCRRHRAGFQARLRKAGASPSAHLVSRNYAKDADRWRKFNAGLADWIGSWTPPVGVCVSFDLLCRYLADACRRKKLVVPNDVALIGLGNEPVICRQPEPSLSSIDHGYRRIGYLAAELLDRLMDGRPAPSGPVWVEPAELVPRRSTDASAVDDPLVAAAMRLIAEHAQRPIGVGDVAAGVPVSRRSLERRFQASLGRTIAQEITRLRIERVKRRLIETDTPINVLAPASGFLDAKQMCKVFLRVEGVSPGAYRRSRRQDV